MSRRPLGAAAAALALSGVAVLGLAAPSSAQDSPYPPRSATTISDPTPAPGQTITVSAGPGSFTPGSDVEVAVPGLGESVTVQADSEGGATVTFDVPDDAAPGRYVVTFTGERETEEGVLGTFLEVPFTVSADGQGTDDSTDDGTAAGGVSDDDALPRTGMDGLIPLTVTGVALVGAGISIVVASRLRRETLPTALA